MIFINYFLYTLKTKRQAHKKIVSLAEFDLDDFSMLWPPPSLSDFKLVEK